MGSRLLLALDETDPLRAFSVAEAAAPHLAGIKINWPLLMQGGLETVAKLAKLAPVICDLKVADIPNTARLIAEAAYGAGATGIIAHAFPGAGPLRAIRDVAPDRDLYAVITMSHPGGGEFFDITALAAVARDGGATGVVAPATRPEDITAVREAVGNLKIIAPGVGAQGGDPRAAITAGADLIIVGRAIYQTDDPGAAAREFAAALGD
ncbi:MAG: orotidine-5'-phosphate decarboxylase [Candidatus Poseidoniia archaeon]|jgi:orotidine-5'-phosphate decarboxylase|nr:orotidine-5'-phosphate decarboxylase [Euryarchaeota archaeon]MDP6274780.1 orotidine-5'-phosphate decarboxylase [Candidatus Poseidoniia archaeon]MDP7135878.1 orotidine-5'-phosphate decarboxylase [Candidatus Poseidoniia archaeon]MDP7243346.1 orotidine-5'-phosphate decarboxylase [Candidatus Poseidoniia archaeon]MDP7535598.1 orotidine-5'-phosphate decarboxylase [Candidatus Poseidoniia archaeon]|tara:strand:- start:4699 stop:5325 length:627 start_codon:yes stop_codon:yes gene_type:complete